MVHYLFRSEARYMSNDDVAAVVADFYRRNRIQ